MKIRILLFTLLSLSLFSCNDDVENAKPEYVSGKVEKIVLSPTKMNLYVDSELPKIKSICVPTNLENPDITWSSSNTSVLDVDGEGQLIWGTCTNATITITATSSSGASASCVVTVRNVMNNYHYIDARDQCGLWILDRNIGATQAFEFGNNDLYRSYVGDLFLYCYNSPAANYEFGGTDGKGGDYTGSGGVVRGGYPTWDNKWTASDQDERFSDWSVADNAPGLSGWRLPTKEECEKIAYAADANNFKEAKAKKAATALRRKLCLVNTGQWTNAGIWNGANCYTWTSTWNPSTKKAWCLCVMGADKDELANISVVELPLTHPGSAGAMALPIRLVRSASESNPE